MDHGSHKPIGIYMRGLILWALILSTHISAYFGRYLAWRVISLESSYKHYVHVTSIEVFKTLTHSFENGAVGYGYIFGASKLYPHM